LHASGTDALFARIAIEVFSSITITIAITTS